MVASATEEIGGQEWRTGCRLTVLHHLIGFALVWLRYRDGYVLVYLLHVSEARLRHGRLENGFESLEVIAIGARYVP